MVETFSYEKGRLVTSVLGEDVSNYIYDGNKILRIETAVNNPAFEFYNNTFEFEHDGKKISKIIHTIDASILINSKTLMVSPLRHFLPEDVCNVIALNDQKDAKMAQQAGIKASGVVTRVYTLTWEGKIVVKMECVCTSTGSVNNNYTESFTMTHDKMNNPFNGLFSFEGLMYEYGRAINHSNNVLTMDVNTIRDDISTHTSYAYSFTYDKDDYPSTVVCTHNLGGSDEVTTYKYTYVE